MNPTQTQPKSLQDKLIERALNNPKSGYIVRYSNLGVAIRACRSRNRYRTTPIILGDDGKFWLAPNNKVAAKLQAMGYEVA